MIRVLAIAGCAALAAPAFAQQTPYPDRAVPPAQSQVPPEQAPLAAADVAQIVAAEFPTYDADRSGLLDPGEFSRWVRTLRAASPGQPPMAEADLQAWTVAAFTQADADLNKGVDAAEMTAFLVRSGS
jgi:hypothetical protein